MESIITSMALPGKQSTYTKNLPHLCFVMREDGYKVPIIHYIVDPKLPTLLWSHGNGQDLGDIKLCKMVKKFNANFLWYDYSGYGLHTQRKVSEKNCQKDILTVYNYLIKQNITNVIIYGYSIGTGVSCWLAHYLSQRGIYLKLILVATFRSVTRVVVNMSLPGDIFKNDLIAPCIKCKTLLIHGCCDYITDIKPAYELACLFPNMYDFVVVHNANHATIEKTCKYVEAINNFIAL